MDAGRMEAEMMESYEKRRLDKAYKEAKLLPYNDGSKIVLMSDCHRGQGNSADNFLFNQNLFFGALEYYNKNKFTYIELGDGDELWENRSMKPIIEVHSDAFWMMKQFYEDGRFHMLYGNHDIVKSRQKYWEKHCTSYYCECEKQEVDLFPGLQVQQSILLEHEQKKQQILLLHGHQGELLNDRLWMLARFLVRYVWRSLELAGVLDPTRAGRSHKVKDRIERRLDTYARENDQLIIAGHTHRPFFPEPGNGHYFNDGSCVHPRCITCIEIEHDQISLVKWSVCTREDRTLYVGRSVLEGPVDISAYVTVK